MSEKDKIIEAIVFYISDKLVIEYKEHKLEINGKNVVLYEELPEDSKFVKIMKKLAEKFNMEHYNIENKIRVWVVSKIEKKILHLLDKYGIKYDVIKTG